MVECGERLYADDPAGKVAAKVMAKDAFTHVTSAPVTATAPRRWMKSIENKFAETLRIPSQCRCPQCGSNDRPSAMWVMASTVGGRYFASSLQN